MNRIALFAVACCMLLLACGGDTTSPAKTSAVGTWSLSTYDDKPLPVVLSQSTFGKVEFVDDVFTMTSDLKYVETGHVRSTPNNGAPTTTTQGDVGTYTNVNGTVTFTSTAGHGVDVGTIAANKLTIVFQGHTYVYLRS